MTYLMIAMTVFICAVYSLPSFVAAQGQTPSVVGSIILGGCLLWAAVVEVQDCTRSWRQPLSWARVGALCGACALGSAALLVLPDSLQATPGLAWPRSLPLAKGVCLAALAGCGLVLSAVAWAVPLAARGRADMREIRALRDLLDSGQPEGSIELVRCLQSRSRHVRRAAGRALRASCATTVLEAGARVLAARNRTVVDGVARALGRAGPAAFPILVDALTSDPSRRAGAARALFLAARSADWRRLEGLLTGEDGHLVWWAARLLERSAPSAAGRQHAAQTRRDCEAAAARAYRAIVATGRPDAVEVLSAALHSHGSLAMAEDLLNCGQSDLAEAATRWAGARGYLIRRRPGVPLVRWGRNR